MKAYLFHLINDSLESLGIIHGEVSENLTVDLDTSLVNSSYSPDVRQH